MIDPTAPSSTTEPAAAPAPHIGTLNEGSLHAALKTHYARPGDRFEVPLRGFVIDIERGDQLIEIQTGSFGAMGNKLDRLLGDHRVLLVYPVAVETRLVRPDTRPRRSPKRGSVYQLFDELVSIPTLIDHPNLTLDVALVKIDRVQRHDPRARRGRGGYRTVDKVLTELVGVERFDTVDDLRRLLPLDLPEEFTTADLAAGGGFDRASAQKMAYCFVPLGVFEQIGRTRAGYHYRLR
ncbi:MAG: hypothetical protein R2733_26585 [Acidimicrobiales bacterium]